MIEEQAKSGKAIYHVFFEHGEVRPTFRKEYISLWSRLSSMTLPSGSTSTGTVPFGEAASIASGLAESLTSRSKQGVQLTAIASLVRIA